MKKRLAITLAVIGSVLVLAACGGKQETATGSEAKDAAQETVQETSEETAETAKVEIPDLSGAWDDEVSQRAPMDVTKNSDGSYSFLVHWGGSATETAIWEISGKFDEATGVLTYEDGKYSIHTFDDQEKETISGEETTKGAFLKEGDKLRWQDSKNTDDGVFVKVK